MIGYVTMLIGVLAVALPISVLSSTFGDKMLQQDLATAAKVRC
jgi:hypothetical protein